MASRENLVRRTLSSPLPLPLGSTTLHRAIKHKHTPSPLRREIGFNGDLGPRSCTYLLLYGRKETQYVNKIAKCCKFVSTYVYIVYIYYNYQLYIYERERYVDSDVLRFYRRVERERVLASILNSRLDRRWLFVILYVRSDDNTVRYVNMYITKRFASCKILFAA